MHKAERGAEESDAIHKPSVLFLDHTAALGGAELFLETLAGVYSGQRKVVLFSDGPLRERLDAARVPVQLVRAPEAVLGVGRGGGGLAQLLAIPGVLQLAREVAKAAQGFDVLFANSQKALVVGAVAARLARKPLVWYLHDIVTAEHFSALNRKLSVFLGNHCAARVLANSEASKEAYVQSGGRPELVSVVYNGIDAEAPAEETAASQDIRSELGLTPEPVVAIFSRLAPWKGQHVLLEALTKLPGVQALLVGAPLFGEEIRYQQELEEQTRASGIAERVRFLGFRNDIPRLLQAVDVIVHTSVAPEPFGRVIVEGMLARKPVVATRAGGACEIIQDGVTGRLVTPGNSEELATTLHRILSTPEEASRLASAGYRVAHERFSVAAMLSGIEGEIARAVGC